jgi:anti-sigma factor RsiW
VHRCRGDRRDDPEGQVSEDRISDSELSALVDGELDAGRQAANESWLADNSEDAQRVARYRSQNAGLHALYDDVLHEDLPPRIASALAPRRRAGVPAWAAMAAAVTLFVAGMAGGWIVRGEAPSPAAGQQVASAPPIDTQELMVRASMVHFVNSSDELRTTSTGRAAELGDYLADRMGKPVRVPRLDTFGYRLLGSRVLPDTDGPAAQFVFSDDQGRKVSLYVRSEQANGVDITYALADDLSMFYWNDAEHSYALVTRLDDEAGREALLDAAKAVHRQLSE